MRKRNKYKRRNISQQPETLSDVWYTAEQLNDLFKISISSINRWRDVGLIYSQPTGRILYNKSDLQAFLVRHRKRKDADNDPEDRDD
ncbi:MAG: helix-turn-helix domain-containing protein [Bacteroidota bacterium]|nr:helix-turn-helix domain-containing protein [Bacteroidota bacterium]